VESSIGLSVLIKKNSIKFHVMNTIIRRIHCLELPIENPICFDASWPLVAALQQRSYHPDLGLSIFSDLLILNIFSVQTKLVCDFRCLNGLTDGGSTVDAVNRLLIFDSDEEYMCA